MKSTRLYWVILVIIIAYVLLSCRDNSKYQPVSFSLPKVTLHYQLPASYLDPDKQETLIRSDSIGPRTFVSIHMLNKQEADMWRIDTMTFRFKNSLSIWDTQNAVIIGCFRASALLHRTKEMHMGRTHQLVTR